MPGDFTINTDLKVVFTIGWDTLTYQDVKNHRTRLVQDERFCQDFGQIIDLTGVTKMDLSSNDVATLAMEPLFASKSCRAIVTGSTLQYGLGRMFEAYGDKQTVAIFQGLDEAAQAVGVPIEVARKSFMELRAKNGLAEKPLEPAFSPGKPR